MRTLTALLILCIPATVLQGQAPLELSLTSWPDCKIVVTNPTSDDVGVTGLDFQSPGGFLIPAKHARPFLFNLQNEPRAVVYAQIPGAVTFPGVAKAWFSMRVTIATVRQLTWKLLTVGDLPYLAPMP